MLSEQARSLMKPNDPLDVKYELPWDYRPFVAAPYVAFDTETTVVDLSREVPRLVLATVSNGRRHVILQPHQVGRFILENLQGASLVGYNTQFDWWVVRQQLLTQWWPEDQKALQIWDALPEQGRLHDAMLLDFLARLADSRDPGVLRMRDLGQAARQWCGLSLGEVQKKKDPYRMRFGELLDVPDWRKADPGFFEYAIKDAVATWHLWGRLIRTKDIRQPESSQAVSRHGPLTEGLQTRASIVLSQVGRNGFALDPRKLGEVKERLRGKIQELVGKLDAEGYGSIFAVDTVKKRLGQRMYHQKTGTPKIFQAGLRGYLLDAAVKSGLEEEEVKRTPKGDAVTTALDYWRDLLPEHPLVAYWAEMQDTNKLLQFIVQLDGKEAVHASYRPLVRTGRTSATGPNIQQMPREPWFRELFVARPGHKLVIVDYAAIELRTLAAVLVDRYGESRLAEVIRQGVDPHVYTASLVLGEPYEVVEQKVAEEKAATKAAEKAGLPRPPAPYSRARQSAKAINFGVPGGLGPPRLAMYAKTQYGVDLTVEEAAALRDTLVTKVYPELSRYLEQDEGAVMAANLGCTPEELTQAWRSIQAGVFKGGYKDSRTSFAGFTGILGGQMKKDGKPYSPRFAQAVWGSLYKVCRNPALRSKLVRMQGSPDLYRRIMGQSVTTLTGRVRGGASYTEARNTPFQGLAADGAKVALWNLHRAGFKIVAFIHDEVVCEVPAVTAPRDRERIERVMVESMEGVLGHGIPVAVEGHVSDRWTK